MTANSGNTRARGAALRAGLCLIIILSLSGSALAAGVVTGRGMVVEKDAAAGLLKLHTGVVLRVSATTRITSAGGSRIGLGDLVIALRDGGVVANGDAMIRYKGYSRGGKVVAYSIRVTGKIPL